MANFFKATKKAQTTTQVLTTTISHINHAGCGVARYKKLPLFIEGALAGETVEAKVVEKKSKYVKAKLLKVITASEEREQPRCKHFQLCGGCDLQHLAYQGQLTLKKQTITTQLSRHGFDQDLPWQAPITSQPWHYRRKARIGVQYNKHGQAIVGFRQKASNNLTVVKSCPILDEHISDIFPVLTEIIDQHSIKQAIGHVEVIVTNVTSVVLRVLKKLSEADLQLWQGYAQQHQWQVIFDDGKTLTPLADAKLSLSYTLGKGGDADLSSGLCSGLNDELNITFSAQDFIQVNDNVNQKMIAQALNWLELDADDVVLDLFSGLGNFSLPIAQQVKQLVGIEGVQTMVDKAQANAAQNGLSNCQFYQADLNSDWQSLESSEKWLQPRYNKVLLDPARAGALAAVEQFNQLNVNTVLYVSCDVASLAKDAQALAKQGYQIQKIALMDMFSQTKHVETMVLFSK